MPRSDPLDATLGGLLTALRRSGVTVGIIEVNRLRHVLSLGPGLDDPARLASVLRALLVKTPEDRARFDHVFDAWLARDAATTPGARARAGQRPDAGVHSVPSSGNGPAARLPVPPGSRRTRPADRPGRRRVRAAALAGLGLAVIALLAWRVDHCLPDAPAIDAGPHPAMPDAAVPDAGARDAGPGDPDTPSACAPEALAQVKVPVPTPTLEVIGGEARPGVAGPLALCLLALGCAAAGWRWLRHRHIHRVPKLDPPGPGPGHTLLTPAVLRGPVLLDARDQDTLVWGIGRFVSEQLTRRIDIDATVRDTARSGGIPCLRFHHARFHREVWLWLDTSADHPDLAGMAEAVARVLRASGLPVERARFNGVPERLVSAEREVFTPRLAEEHRHGVTVAVLTDGRALCNRYRSEKHRARIQDALRSLAHWPHLTIVDFSAAGHEAGETTELAALARAHGLAVVAPSGLAAFLGASDAASAMPVADDDTLAPWAAACAVCPAPVAESTAHRLRQVLSLPLSPWALHTLRALARGPAGYLAWSRDARQRHLAWLRDAERDPVDDAGGATGETAAPTTLRRALDFWEQHYDDEERRRCEAGGWKGSAAHQRLRLERALLWLWRQPVRAADELGALFRGSLEDEIRAQLGMFRPADRPDGAAGTRGARRCVRLLWRWDTCPVPTRIALQAMGLGGDLPAEIAGRPGRLWLGLGACAGAAAGALAAGIVALSTPIEEVQVEPGREGAWAHVAQQGDAWRVTVMTAQAQHTVEDVPAGALVRARWSEPLEPCMRELAQGTVWRCGAGTQRIPADEDERRTVAIVEPGPPAPASDGRAWVRAEDLALALLDCGEADLVYVGNADGWTEDRATLFDASTAGEPLPVPIPVSERNDRFFALVGRGCSAGVQMVDIRGDTFWMGTRDEDGDSGADDDEKPARQVALDGFGMGRCEVTNRQYWAFRQALQRGQAGKAPEEPPAWSSSEYADPEQPVITVSWHEATAFCRHFDYELPTEAEWEYACRAGTRTPWSFGSDENKLGDHAWYEANADVPHRVGTRAANPWGLHDMHGNVWEWVADWYGPYLAKDSVDRNPSGPVEAQAPVDDILGEKARGLRGGSFANGPRFLRCAFRFWFRPGFRYWFSGFRCVRGSARQP